jgi:acrosin
MVLIQDGQVEVLAFDLIKFYQTSSIVEGLELTNPNSTLDLGPGINQVREEIQDALEQYTPLDDDQSILLNPAMISVTGTDESVADQPWLLTPEANPTNLTAERSLIPLPAGVQTETTPAEDNEIFSPPRHTPTASNGQEPEPQFPPGVELPSSDSPAPTDEVVSPGEPTVEPSPLPSQEPPGVIELPDSSPEPSVEQPSAPPLSPPPVEPPEPPIMEIPDPVSDGPGRAEPPPFNGFPGRDLPNPSLEDGPGRADPPPFRDD